LREAESRLAAAKKKGKKLKKVKKKKLKKVKKNFGNFFGGKSFYRLCCSLIFARSCELRRSLCSRF
jgi:Mor family transcriptional regulator